MAIAFSKVVAFVAVKVAVVVAFVMALFVAVVSIDSLTGCRPLPSWPSSSSWLLSSLSVLFWFIFAQTKIAKMPKEIT